MQTVLLAARRVGRVLPRSRVQQEVQGAERREWERRPEKINKIMLKAVASPKKMARPKKKIEAEAERKKKKNGKKKGGKRGGSGRAKPRNKEG